MYFIYMLLSVVAVTAVPCYENEVSSDVYTYDLEDAEYHFNEYIKKFDKDYDSDEREHRFGIFKENLKKINHLNAMKNLNLHGITQFADMKDEEFMDYASCLNNEEFNMTGVNVISLQNLPEDAFPDELDYRTQNMVSEVKNQGLCNVCYIFAAVENIEGQYAKAHGQIYSLSEQEVLDCMAPDGCDKGGFPYNVMQNLATYGGIVTEGNYPFIAQRKSCTVDKNQIVVRVQSGNMIQGGEAGLVEALNTYGPLAVGITVVPSLKSLNNGNVFNDPTCATQSIGRHAVLLIGYGTNSEGPFWLIKNSWGTNWGEGGFFRMARGVGMCSIGTEVVTATVS